MRAADLVGGHRRGCSYDPTCDVDGCQRCVCTCRLAERQADAAALDARVEALEGALREARPWMSAALAYSVRPGSDMGGVRLLGRIDALLAESP